MKKIILSVFFALLLCGCKTDVQKPIDNNQKYYGEKFTFEGHQYIVFSRRVAGQCGIVHDPDCECMIDYD